jgi:hypothetical protein
MEYKRVEEVFRTRAVICHVHVAGHVIRTTAGHPFYVWNKGWMPAWRLQPGDLLRSHDGKMVAVEEVCDTGVEEDVYNCRVAGYHTYFVGPPNGDCNVWVHNSCTTDMMLLTGLSEGRARHAVSLFYAGDVVGAQAYLVSRQVSPAVLTQVLRRFGNLGTLIPQGPYVWRSAAGLRYVGTDGAGRNRVQHVLRHAQDMPTQPGPLPFGVFDSGPSGALGVVDEAWLIVQLRGPGVSVAQQGNRTIYTVSMGRRIGFEGGQVGAATGNQGVSRVQLVVENGNQVITAFPIR